jgi:hypothetical protein
MYLPVGTLTSRDAVRDLGNTNGHHFDLATTATAGTRTVDLRQHRVLGQRRDDTARARDKGRGYSSGADRRETKQRSEEKASMSEKENVMERV